MSSAVELDQQVQQHMVAGNTREAAELCDQMNQQFPDYEHGWLTASRLAMFVNEPMLAVRAIDRALVLSPGKPEWLFYRVECLGAHGAFQEARTTALKITGHLFESAEISSTFALSLSRLGLYDDSRRHYGQATKIDPENSANFYNLATVERFLGNIDAAQAALTRCLDLSPNDSDAHFLRANLKTHSANDNNIEALKAAYGNASESADQRARICYAISKELDDLGDYDQAFKYLTEGSTLRRAGIEYTPQNDLDAMQAIRENYTAEKFDGRIAGHVDREPIFVIGLPRSGTALVDRILNSHSVVQSTGELPTFSSELGRLCEQTEGGLPGSPAELVPRSVGIDFEALGAAYVASARPKAGSIPHFIDKFPLNFLYAGLIHLALPKAKIILLERDIMDVCYAVYKTSFDGAYPFSYDQQELGQYLLAYQQLIDHWQSVMPNVIHVVKYEELVTNNLPVVEGLLSYCELSFEDACLKYFENQDDVTAANAIQLRDEFLRASIGKWHNYEKQLAPVMEILGR